MRKLEGMPLWHKLIVYGPLLPVLILLLFVCSMPVVRYGIFVAVLVWSVFYGILWWIGLFTATEVLSMARRTATVLVIFYMLLAAMSIYLVLVNDLRRRFKQYFGHRDKAGDR